MEEIDIIELFRRVKEGKAPVWIEVGGNKYKYYGEGYSLEYLYIDKDGDGWLRIESVDTDTKIKILDKPIIEELNEIERLRNTPNPNELYMKDEINKIIRHLNLIVRHINKEAK